MRFEEDVAETQGDPRDVGPSDAPLAIVYLGIICCAVSIMVVLAVAAAT